MSDRANTGISQGEHKRISEELSKLNLVCQACGSMRWNFIPEVFGAPVYRGGEMTWGALRMLALVCTSCGKVEFFSAAKHGPIEP